MRPSTKNIITEGKHWPEDYVKTAFNTIKASALGQQSWYSNEYIQTDLNNIVQEFGPLSHKNSNLGFFATIIRWFIEYSGTSSQKYQEFFERKLDGIIRDLQTILNDPKLDQTKRDQLKKISYAEFEKIQTQIADNIKASDVGFFGVESTDYDLIFIKSYEDLHEMFGGDKTGYQGKSEWCHTNGQSTYASWTSNGTRFFFVLAKKGWEEITPPSPTTTTAYDEYGTSLIAILVDQTGELLNANLRWNHIIKPSDTIAGTSVDRAFLTYTDLSKVVKMDVKRKVIEILKNQNVYSKYGKSVYEGPEGKCVVYDGHLLWLDSNDNEIGIPQKINGDFNCSANKLTSLEGAPQKVGGYFNCAYNSLTSLEGAPQKVGGDFYCSDNKLISLEGSPKKVGRHFYCAYNKQLISLKGAPREVGGDFDCSKSKLTSLEGAPQKVGGYFNCLNNNLTSLKGAPREVGRDFYCSGNKLTSLEGSPRKLDGFFNCSYNNLTSLKGAPIKVGRSFVCSDNNLTSLEGAPAKVGGGVYCSENKLTNNQFQAYIKWLKTKPIKPYHDPYAT